MPGNFNTMHCPDCGSNHLQAQYDETNDKKVGLRLIFGGVLGILLDLFKKKASVGYWKCQQCGRTFPMDIR